MKKTHNRHHRRDVTVNDGKSPFSEGPDHWPYFVAYLKMKYNVPKQHKNWHNNSDNLRLLGGTMKMADNEDDIDTIEIALDAQKVFDSVNHQDIITVLNRIGLHIFVPIFKLSYQDLKNDIIKNGKIGNGYNFGNGVK